MDFDFGDALTRLHGIVIDGIVLIPMAIIAIIVFIISMLIARYVQKLVDRTVRASHRPDSLAVVLSRLARWATIGFGAVLSALIMFPGFSAGELIQLMGLGGLAAGIAFRSIFEDFFSGILLLLNQPFNLGDQIIMDGHEGTIEEIQTRITYIRTYDGRRVVIPNSKLFTNVVIVNTAYPQRRMQHDIGIGYGDDIQLARRIILETLDTIDSVLKTPEPKALVVDLADYAIIIQVRWWVEPPRNIDLMEARDQVLEQVRTALTEYGIDLPFPTQQVLFHNQTEETDGDRRYQREGWPASPGDISKPRSIAYARHRLASPSKPEQGEQ